MERNDTCIYWCEPRSLDSPGAQSLLRMGWNSLQKLFAIKLPASPSCSENQGSFAQPTLPSLLEPLALKRAPHQEQRGGGLPAASLGFLHLVCLNNTPASKTASECSAGDEETRVLRHAVGKSPRLHHPLKSQELSSVGGGGTWHPQSTKCLPSTERHAATLVATKIILPFSHWTYLKFGMIFQMT